MQSEVVLCRIQRRFLVKLTVVDDVLIRGVSDTRVSLKENEVRF